MTGDIQDAPDPTEELVKKSTALGTLIRAGVKPGSAAATVGLPPMDFYPGQPVTIRDPAEGA